MATESKNIPTGLRDSRNKDTSRNEREVDASRQSQTTASQSATSYIGPPPRLPKGQYTNEEIENAVLPVGYEARNIVGNRPDTASVERDPYGTDPHAPGAKLDAGKAPIMQGALMYFPRALEQIALVSLYGATKYHWKGWEKVPDGANRYGNAAVRHITKEETEGLYDLESIDLEKERKFLHAVMVAWNALARAELLLREGK